MSVRKLTSEFLRLRGEYHASAGGSSGRSSSFGSSSGGGLLPGGGADASSSWEQARHTLPPYWVDTVDEINASLQNIRDKISQLEDVHRRRLMAFDDREQQQLESEIDTLTKHITSRFQASERSLKRIFGTKKAPGNTDEVVRRNIQRSLAVQLQELTGEFRKSQRTYLEKIQRKKQETRGEGFGGGDVSVDIDDGDAGFSQVQTEMIRNNLQDIQQRDQEITEIAKSIEDLATVFKELAVLVIDQGTILDRIDYNMEQAVDRVDDGVAALTRARDYQKASRPLKCICCLVTIIIILIIALIIKHQPKGGDNSNNNNRRLGGFDWDLLTA